MLTTTYHLLQKFLEHVLPGVQKVKLPDTVDRDEVDELDDPPSVVCYFIVYGNENEIFHLEPVSHILTVIIRSIHATHPADQLVSLSHLSNRS